MNRLIIAICVLVVSIGHAATVNLLKSTVVDHNALNFSSSIANFNRNVNGRTYQRFPMVTSKGYQYATYYDENRNVALGRRKLPDGAWDVIRFTDYEITSSDSHNIVSVGICENDGTIHLAFDHHADALNYRISNIGVASHPEDVVWDANLFSPVTDRLGSVGRITGLTYPSFFKASNGNLMLYYRSGGSGNGDGIIQEYNGIVNDWTAGLGKFISRSGTYSGDVSNNSTSRCPYINGIFYGGDRLHASWGWRESSAGSSNNHDLNYAYSDDHGRTWYNNAGTKIGTTGSGTVISINSPELIVGDIPQNIGLSNQYTHYAYADGSCHVMVAHSGSYQHYWRNAAGIWNHAALSFSGSRPKMTGDADGSLFLVYTTGGKPAIAKGVPNTAKTAWIWSRVYTQNVSEGGEGQLDYSRWETDRILSIYGQEQPATSAEVPSKLHVFDYQVSTKAILPVPVHDTEVLDIDSGLQWMAGLNADSHRIYFGTNPVAVASATTSAPEYQGQQSGTSFDASGLLTDATTYYWRVDEVAGDNVSPGLLWSFSFSAPNIEYPNAPIAHWTLDEGTGTVAEDSTGYKNTGTLLNGAVWGSDEIRDSYVSFDGTDDRIATMFKYALADTQDFTWAWWASKQTPVGTDDGSIMVGNRYGNTGSETYEFIKFTPEGAQFSNTSNTSEIEKYSYADVTDDGWHHYAMVKSGSRYQWYVDGVAQGVASNFNYSETSSIPFFIGGDTDNKPNEHFLGFIDDVVLYRSALSTEAVENIKGGIYLPTVTMMALDAPVELTEGSTWSDDLPAHPRADYIIPNTGNLRSENGISTFPGESLTVEAGGKFQFLGKSELGEVTTVTGLITTGGVPNDAVTLAAGTGNNTENHLAGTIRNDGYTVLAGYGNDTGARNIRISSVISGDGTLFSSGTSAYPHTCTIDNPTNSFAGTWQSNIGSLVFENAQAVGAADVDVLDAGTLEIVGDWNADASLTVADSATAQVKLGSYRWIVSEFVFGGVSIADGDYDVDALNALGSFAVFTGSGTITVNSSGLFIGTLYSVASDASIKESGTVVDIDSSTTLAGVGGSSPWVDRSTVYVFQLPDVGRIDNPFLNTSFSFNYDGKDGTLKNIDLYGIGKRSAADVLGSDYYGQTATLDPTDATIIQTSLLTDSTDFGIIITENDALTDYLNAQYEGGAGVGHYVFLRLSSTTEKTGISRAKVTMSEGGLADTRPQLSFNALRSPIDESPVMDFKQQSTGDFWLSWTGNGFKVQTRTNLVEGLWEDYSEGDESPVIVAPTNSTGFFRLIEQ